MDQTLIRPDLAFLDDSANLPSLPGIALEVVRLTQRENVEVETVAATIGRDPALAARMLKLSNSSFFGRSAEVATIGEALMVLGLKTVRLAAVSFSVIPAIVPDRSSRYDHREFWARAVIAAVTARCLARHIARELAEEAFIAALLMDISVPIMVNGVGARYEPVLQTMRCAHPEAEDEHLALGTTHGAVTAALLTRWQLPSRIIQMVAHHHDPEALVETTDRPVRTIAQILNVAHEVATMMVDERDRGIALRRARVAARRWFALEDDAFDGMIEDLTEPIAEMARLIEVDIGRERHAANVLDEARAVLTTVADVQRSAKSSHVTLGIDPVTGVHDANGFLPALASALDAARELSEDASVGVLFIEIDGLPDRLAREDSTEWTDRVRSVAATLQRCARIEDHLARNAFNRFSLVAPGLTPIQVRAMAQRIVRSTNGLATDAATSDEVTVSVAGVSARQTALEGQRMLARLEELMVVARGAGGGQLRVDELI